MWHWRSRCQRSISRHWEFHSILRCISHLLPSAVPWSDRSKLGQYILCPGNLPVNLMYQHVRFLPYLWCLRRLSPPPPTPSLLYSSLGSWALNSRFSALVLELTPWSSSPVPSLGRSRSTLSSLSLPCQVMQLCLFSPFPAQDLDPDVVSHSGSQKRRSANGHNILCCC